MRTYLTEFIGTYFLVLTIGLTVLGGTERLADTAGVELRPYGARVGVGYFAELGVSHLYLSPVLQAQSGSTHGYDVVDQMKKMEARPAVIVLTATHADATTLERLDGPTPADAVILDVLMPGLDGRDRHELPAAGAAP